MKQYEFEKIREKLNTISKKNNNVIKEVNSNITSLYNTISSCSSSVQSIKQKVGILGDMITDLTVLTGKTKTSVYVSELDIVESTGIDIDKSSVTLSKNKETVMDYNAKLSTIYSEKPYSIYDENSKSKTIEDLFKYKSLSNLICSTLGYQYTFTLKFSALTKINKLRIKLPNTSESFPFIQNINYLSSGYTYEDLAISNNKSRIYSFDDNRFKNNIYDINFNTINTTEIKFTLFSSTSKVLSLDYIEAIYAAYSTEGSIILGPIVSNEPILKVSIQSSDFSNNVSSYLSTDRINWIKLEDTNKMTNDRKVLSFNTINSQSYSTEEDVKEVYLRIDLKAEKEDLQDSSYYSFIREDGSVSVIDSIEQSKFSAYRVKDEDLSYGISKYSNNLSLSEKTKINIQTFKENGLAKIRGFEDTFVSYGNSGNSYSSVDVTLNPLRLPTSRNIDASQFDSINGKLYDITVIPFMSNINTTKQKDICFKLKLKEDTYKLSIPDKKEILLSISKNFITNSDEVLVQVPYEDIELKFSNGDIVKIFKKEDHKMIGEGENIVYIISLIDVLYELPIVKDYSINKYYPLVPNKSKEYSIEDSHIVLGKGSIVDFEGYKIQEEEARIDKNISYENGNTWIRKSTLYTTSHTQTIINDKEISVFKLDHISIEKGSLRIYEYNKYGTLGEESNVFISIDSNDKNQFIKVEEDSYLEE